MSIAFARSSALHEWAKGSVARSFTTKRPLPREGRNLAADPKHKNFVPTCRAFSSVLSASATPRVLGAISP